MCYYFVEDSEMEWTFFESFGQLAWYAFIGIAIYGVVLLK